MELIRGIGAVLIAMDYIVLLTGYYSCKHLCLYCLNYKGN